VRHVPGARYLTDDTFIHLQFARHLASGSGPVFNVGERVYGCTSPLWMALIALGIRLGAMASSSRGAGRSRDARLGGAVLPARAPDPAQPVAARLRDRRLGRQRVDDPLVALRDGTPLATALTLAGFASLTATEPWGRARARTGVLWALAALTRPEATALLAMWGLALLADPANRARPARLLAGLLPPLLLVGSWLLFARSYYGLYWPQTLSAKAAGSGGLAGLLDNLRRWGRSWARAMACLWCC